MSEGHSNIEDRAQRRALTAKLDRNTTVSVGLVVLIIGGLLGVAAAAGHSIQRIEELEAHRQKQLELNSRVVTAIERLTERSEQQQRINEQVAGRQLRIEEQMHALGTQIARLQGGRED